MFAIIVIVLSTAIALIASYFDLRFPAAGGLLGHLMLVLAGVAAPLWVMSLLAGRTVTHIAPSTVLGYLLWLVVAFCLSRVVLERLQVEDQDLLSGLASFAAAVCVAVAAAGRAIIARKRTDPDYETGD